MPGALSPAPRPVAASAETLGVDEFALLMKGFEPLPERIALAVSGGPDSMALAWCAKDWSAQKKFSILAFIVNHGLRLESTAEAEETQKRLAKIGIESEILRWEHAPVVTRIHVSARKARYRLLTEACRRHDVDTLLLAHQMEDQAETILMRLAKGSGIDGLAGMNAAGQMDGVRLLRPFLNIPKERLIATCRAAGLKFIEDASNRSDKFARGRLRKVMPLLAEEGLTVERLADLAARAGEAKEALDHATREFLRDASQRDEADVIRIALEKFRAVPRAIAGRALALGLRDIHAGDYAPEHAALTRLRDALRAPIEMTARTLHGCLVGKNADTITIMREFAAITDAPPIRPGESIVWDGRWRVSLGAVIPDNFPDAQGIREVDPESSLVFCGEKNKLDSGFLSHARESSVPESADRSSAQVTGPGMTEKEFTIRPLGSPSHEVLDALAPGLRKFVPQGRVRAGLPALWNGDRLALIPSLKDQGPARAQLVTAWPPG